MRKPTLLVTGALSIAALALAGCDVEKTQEGNVSLPKYEVEKTQEGNVRLPKYDVDAPDVRVSQTEKEVTVPKVRTEKETITLPKVDVTPAQDKDDEAKKQTQR